MVLHQNLLSLTHLVLYKPYKYNSRWVCLLCTNLVRGVLLRHLQREVRAQISLEVPCTPLVVWR